MDYFNFFHKLNIIVHVINGTLALLIAVVAFASKKGAKLHIKSGRIFTVLLGVVVFTGLLGVFIFKVNTFLLVVTLLSGYNAYSGIRILKTKSNTPKLQDILVGLLCISSGCYFLYYMKSIGMFWEPVVVYSTIGFLFALVAYDFLRYLIPANKYRKLWLYEHIYKMTAAFTALLSAAVGTIFPNHKPFSQIGPSAAGTLLGIAFIVYFYRKNNQRAK